MKNHYWQTELIQNVYPAVWYRDCYFNNPYLVKVEEQQKVITVKNISYINYLCAQFQWKIYIVFATVLFSYLLDWIIEMWSYVFWVKRLKDFYYFISLLFITFLGFFFFFLHFIRIVLDKNTGTWQMEIKKKNCPLPQMLWETLLWNPPHT